MIFGIPDRGNSIGGDYSVWSGMISRLRLAWPASPEKTEKLTARKLISVVLMSR
jgi:hypothetical protein